MGMANSAQSFQRLVESVLGDLKDRGIFIYLDDLLIFNKNKKDHLLLLEDLFKRLSENGLSIALDKCIFGVKSLDYLGYNISAEGLAPIDKKIDALQKFPPPNKQKDLLGFLGALNYYRASLPNLAPEESVNKNIKHARSPAEILDPLYKVATCSLQKRKTSS